METKCSAFWHHTNIRNDNNVFACCRYKTPVTKFTGNVVSILNTTEYKKLREESSNGVYNPNCQKCYYEESLGKKSLRQQFNEEYTTETINLNFLEVGLDNICNLTCDGCWHEFSSAWAKKSNITQIVRSSEDLTTLPATVNRVLFLGGEPLMTTRHLRILKIANRTLLDVTYNTNGTFLLDKETIELLNECKHVKFILSIDGYGELNDKVRSGSKWIDIIKFIEQIKNLNFELVIHTVIHLNNWQGLPKLAEFIKSINLEWTTNVLTYPKKLDIVNMFNKTEFISMIEQLDIPNKKYMLEHVKLKNPTMLDYRSYPYTDQIDTVKTLAVESLNNLDWRSIRARLRSMAKDTNGKEVWWYSKSSKDNKVYHETNTGVLSEDIEYTQDSGHFNIQVNTDTIPEFKDFKNTVEGLPGLHYAGVFFIGPNSYVEDHIDKGMYNVLINVCVPTNAFLTVDDEQFYFNNNQIVMFDGDLHHSATNNSKEDWILFVLRITKKEF